MTVRAVARLGTHARQVWAPRPAPAGTPLPARQCPHAVPGESGYTCRTAGRISGVNALSNPAAGVPSGVPKVKNCVLEGKRMASGHTGNVVPRKGLRVRLPCPPLHAGTAILAGAGWAVEPAIRAGGPHALNVIRPDRARGYTAAQTTTA